MPHAGGRSLLEHLIGTAELLGRWGQPDAIRRAALIHSVYGTDVYRHAMAGRGTAPSWPQLPARTPSGSRTFSPLPRGVCCSPARTGG